MAQTKSPEKKIDALPIVAIALGGVGAAVGIFFWLKKPSGVSIGDTVRAHFKFDYSGEGGSYVLVVRFGWYKPVYLPLGFDPEEGMDRYTKTVILAGSDTYEFDVDCRIPDGAKASTYDAEGSILLPDMEPGLEWLTRVFTKKAITVRKE